jgi:hypothetical protein
LTIRQEFAVKIIEHRHAIGLILQENPSSVKFNPLQQEIVYRKRGKVKGKNGGKTGLFSIRRHFSMKNMRDKSGQQKTTRKSGVV